MARVEFDFSELEAWTDVLMRAPAITEKQARAVLSKGGLNIKNEARRNAPGGGAAKHYPNSINYDLYDEPGGLLDHEQVGVLVGEDELGCRARGPRRLGEVDLELLAACEAVALRPSGAVEAHCAGPYEPLGESA